MVLPKNTLGRRCSSKSGSCPVLTNCNSVPVITSGMGGHPETLMMGLSPTMAVTGNAIATSGAAGYGAVNHQDVLAKVILHRRRERRFREVARRSHQRVAVVQRNDVE